MRRITGLGMCAIAAIILSWQGSAYGVIGATSTLSDQQIGPTSYEYSLTLTNTSADTTINTFWTGWIVYSSFYVYDLLPTMPTSVLSPSGWTGAPVHDSIYSPSGYYGVEWTSATGLAPGQSLSGFKFDSADPPSTVEGTSFFAGYPVRESWVYQGASQATPGLELTPTIVPLPEPAAVLLAPAILLFTGRRIRTRRIAST